MIRRAAARLAPALPQGKRDALRQVALIVVGYLLYELAAGISHHDAGAALQHAGWIVSWERSLGAFFEPGLEQAALHQPWAVHVANWIYLDGHFALTSAFLLWLYLRRNRRFYYVRNTFLAAMALALVVYIAFPVAPPRMFANLGFTDTLAAFSGINQDHGSLQVLIDPYAAVPSVHVAFATLVAVAAWRTLPWRPARLAALGYPVLIALVTFVTGNHLWFDAVTGAACAGAACLAAAALARARPAHWGWPARAVRPEPRAPVAHPST